MYESLIVSPADNAPAPAAGGSPLDAALQAEGVTGQVADLARSVYQQESSSGANTRTSNAGAVGGMQVIPATFKSVADPDWSINDPVQNARAGVRYLKAMYDKAGGDPRLAAAGYYGGPDAIDKARRGQAVSDPRNPGAPNTLQYGEQVASRVAANSAPLVQTAEAGKYDSLVVDPIVSAAPVYFEPVVGKYSSLVVPPSSLLGDAKMGAARGFEQSKGLAAGALALISNTVNDGEVTDFQRNMMGYYQARMDDAQKLQSTSTSFTEAAFGDGSLARWAADSAGYLGYQIGEAVLTGGLGGVLGKTIGKKVVADVATGMVEKEIVRLAATEAGKKLSKEAVASTAAANVARNISAGTSLFLNNVRQEGGSIYGDALEQAQKSGEPIDLGRIWAASVAAAGVDTAADVLAAKGVLGLKEGSSAPSYLGRAAREVPKAIGVQGGTEGVQTVIERAGAKQEIFSPEGVKDIVDSMAVGGFGGLGGGLGSAVHSSKAEVPPALQPVADKAAEGGTLSKAAMQGAAATAAAQQNAPAPVDPAARLAELEAISKGTPRRLNADSEGLPVEVPAVPGRFFTPEEQAEYQKLKGLKETTDQAAGVNPQQDAVTTAEAKVQAEEKQRDDDLTQRSAAIAAAIRKAGGLQVFRAEGAPVDSKAVIADLAVAQSPSTPAARREQALARLEYALEWAGVSEAAAKPGAPQDAAVGASPEIAAAQAQQDASNQEAAAKQPPQVEVDRLLPALRVAPALRSAEQTAIVKMAQSRYSPEDFVLLNKVATQSPALMSATDKLRLQHLRGTANPALKAGIDTAAEAGVPNSGTNAPNSGTPAAPKLEFANPQVSLPPGRVAVPADAAGSTTPARFRKRKAQLRQIIDMGLDRVERRADGFYLTDGKREYKLEGPGDAALAHAEIRAKIREGAEQANTAPTDGQKQAGNYKKGRVVFDGLKLGIENPIGSERSGTAPDGKKWSVTMTADYGDLTSTTGADGDGVDIYLAKDPRAGSPVFVFDQYKDDGSFDEHKAVLGVSTLEQAAAIYDSHFSDGSGPRRRRGVKQMSAEEFKAWANSPAATRPAAGDKSGKSGSVGAGLPARGEASGSNQQPGSVAAAGAGPASGDGRVANGGHPAGTRASGATDSPAAVAGGRADVAANEVGAGPDNPESGTVARGKLKVVTIKGKRVFQVPVKDADGTVRDVGVEVVDITELPTQSPARGEGTQRITQVTAKILQMFAAALGKDVVFYRDPNNELGDGFVMPKIDSTIFVRENSSINHLSVLNHEFFHLLKRELPTKVYDDLIDRIAKQLPDGARKKFRDYYHGKQDAHTDAPLNDRDMEELYADLGGTFLSEPAFWRELMDDLQKTHPQEAKSIIAKLAAKIFAMIDHLVEYFAKQGAKPFASAGLVTDIESIRTAYKAALAGYLSANGIRKSAMQAQILKGQTEETKKSPERDAQPRPKVAEAERIIKGIDPEEQVVLYHSGDASMDASLKNGIEPQFGDWLEEVLAGATDDDSLADEIREQDPVAFYSEKPGWIGMKAARAAGKTLGEMTKADVLQHGQLSIVVVDKDDRDIWRAAENGRGTADQFWGRGRWPMDEVPFGVEPGDIFTASSYTPDVTLTGEDLAQFMRRNFPAIKESKERDNSLDEAGQGIGRQSAAPDAQDAGTARYGKPQEGSVSAVGIHYSRQPRKHLDAAYYGQGLKGSERERLSGRENDDIRPRVFFYVDKGKGVRPESGVGGAAHKVQLDNLYDVQKDPLNLVRDNPGANNWERAIMRAGFDGYLNLDPILPQGYAVLVGKKQNAVPVQSTTAPGFTASAAPAEVEKAYESKSLDQHPELDGVDVEKIPGAKKKYGLLTVPLSSREEANAEMERIGSEVRFSKARATDTPAFKRWFGGSKVVDSEGKPLVVYHGTALPKLGDGSREFRPDRSSDLAGIYFTANPKVADDYAAMDSEVEGDPPFVMPVYLSLRNPKFMDGNKLDFDGGSDYQQLAPEFRDGLVAEGYDGVIALDGNGKPFEFVAFRPEQIKSIFNDGSFDPKNPDITRSTSRISDEDARELGDLRRQLSVLDSIEKCLG